MPIKYTRVGWQDAPSMETPIDAANLNHMDNGIVALSEAYDTEISTVQRQFQDVLREVSELKQLVNQRCHVGMIIHSTTLSTEAEVIAAYGGEHWIQHTGYFLYAGNTGVSANNATADGGEATHTLTVNEMPSHKHGLFLEYGTFPSSYDYPTPLSQYNQLGPFGPYSDRMAETGGGQPHNNMPPYKKVYIWECVDAGSYENPTFIEDES